MAETFVTILTAHLIGDFFLQKYWLMKRIQNIGVLLTKVVTVTLFSGLLMGAFHWPILLSIFLVHFGMDAINVYRTKDSLGSFLIDQSTHFAVLIGLACLFPDVVTNGW